MEETISLSRYFEVCKPFLLQDKPEAVQVIFTMLKSKHPEFRHLFANNFHKTIRDYYLVTTLNRTGDWSAIFTGWETANPEWPKNLRTALFAGNVDACAQMQRMSLLQYEADQYTAGR